MNKTPSCRFFAWAVTLLVASIALVMLAGPPANAHGSSNAPSSNFHSRVEAVAPQTDDFSITIIEAASRVELTWRSGPELVVPGYETEPYLRVGPDGVYENQASSATYLNRDRQAATDIPPDTGADKTPRWKRVSSGVTARWHDHRIHWMGTDNPPIVRREPKKAHLIRRWTIPVEQGPASFAVTGSLRWRPGPSPLPFVLPALALAGLCFLLARKARNASRARQRAGRLLCMTAAVLLAVDAVHLVAIAGGIHGPGFLGRLVSIGLTTILAVALVAGGIWLTAKGRDDGLFLIVFGAGVATIAGGLADVDVLSRSATASLLPIAIVRILVSATIGLGLSIVLSGITLLSKRPAQDTADPS